MKKTISLLLCMFLFLSLGLKAQKIEQMWNNAQSIAQSKPQDAIRAYDDLMLKAEHEKRYDILLNAGVERRMVTMNWAPDSLLPYAERLKKREAFVRRSEPVLSSIYSTLLCALGQSDSPDGQAYAQLALAHPELLAHTRVKTKGNTIDKYFHFCADKLKGIRDVSLSGEGRLWLNDKYNGTELTPDSQSVSPTHISFGALYFQSIQSIKDLKAPKGELQVKREIIPLQAGALQVGSHVKVRITLTTTRDLDFVQIIDNRTACMEPVDKTSGYRYSRDCSYYLDVKDNRTNLFIGMLPKGVHVIEQEYYLDRAGTYTTGTVTAQCAYAPEYISTEKGTSFSVRLNGSKVR